MVIIAFLLILNMIIFTFIYLFSREVNRISYSKNTIKVSKNFFLTLIIILFILIWITTNIIIYYYIISYLFFYTTLAQLNQKKILTSLFLFTLVNIFFLFSKRDFNLEGSEPFIYLKILEPLVFSCFFWITLSVKDKTKIFYNLSWIFIILFYSIIEIHFYNKMLISSNLESLIIDLKLGISFILVYWIIQLFLIYLINWFYKNYFKQEFNYQKSNSNYFKPYLRISITKKHIQKLNISKAAIVSLFWEDKKINLDSEFQKLLQEEIDKYYKNVLFFQPSLNSHCLLIPMPLDKNFNFKEMFEDNFSNNRNSDDFYFQLEQISKSMNFKNVKFYISHYGIEDNEISALIDQNNFLINNELNIEYKNNVTLFNNRIYRNYFSDKYKLINFLNLYYFKIKIQKYEVRGFIIGRQEHEIFKYKNEELINFERNSSNIFIFKYLAFKLINFAKSNDLDKFIFYLPIDYWILNVETIIKRLLKLANLNEIILEFNLEQINLNLSAYKTFFNKIKEANLELLIIDFDSSNISKIIDLNPKYFTKKSFQKLKISKTKFIQKRNNLILQAIPLKID